MFFRGEIVKRWVACSGLALALLPCFQQSHAFCRLAGCAADLIAASVHSEAAKSNSCGKCCGAQAESPCDPPTPERHDSWPCGPECCCCQPPDPRDAPRGATESAKTRLMTDGVCVAESQNVAVQADFVRSESFALAR